MSRWQLKKAKKNCQKEQNAAAELKLVKWQCDKLTKRVWTRSVWKWRQWRRFRSDLCQLKSAKIKQEYSRLKRKKNPHFVSSLLKVSTFYSTSGKCFNFEKDQDQIRISASRISCNDFTGFYGAVLRKLTGKQWEKSSKNQAKTTGKV